MAPSLGFLGTVIGMVMAFDKIQQAGDISPTVVSYGGVQAGYLEKGCSWITLFIAMAPSLGTYHFLQNRY